MSYGNDIRSRVRKLLAVNTSIIEISKILKKEFGKTPIIATLSKWKIKYEESVESEAQSTSDYTAIIKTTGRQEWRIKDYNASDQKQGKEQKKIYQDSDHKINKLFPSNTEDQHDNAKTKIYNPTNKDFIESFAREQFHGTTIENNLHLGVCQFKEKGSQQVRTKTVGKSSLMLTSQNHIFPDSEIVDKKNSYHPENIREGDAEFNNHIKAHIDPIIDTKSRQLSNSTIDMINKYNFKDLKDHVPFKYAGDKIVTSNMLETLNTGIKGSFEAPNLGIMDGHKNTVSMNAHSMPIYKFNSQAGILDNPALDPDLRKLFFDKVELVDDSFAFPTFPIDHDQVLPCTGKILDLDPDQ